MLTLIEFLPEGVRVEFVDNHELAYAVNDSYYEVLADILQENGMERPAHLDLSDYQNQDVYLLGTSLQQRIADRTGFSHIEIEQESHDLVDYKNFQIPSAIRGHLYIRFTVCDITAFTFWALQNNLTGLIPDDHQISARFRDHFQNLS